MRSRDARLGLAAFLLAVGAHPCPAGEDAAREAQALESLRAEVRKAVPARWIVEVALVDPERPGVGGPCPALVIRSELPLEVELSYPGMPAGGEAVRRMEPVAIRLVAYPFLTAQGYAASIAAVRRGRDERLAFVRSRLKDAPYASKSPEPIPPEDFRPREDAERRLVLEYALLCRRTESPRLPTHHARGLAFHVAPDENLTIRDESKSREYARIRESLGKLLTPYE